MPIRIAMAALIRRDHVLLAHRHPDRRWYPDCWDLVGGHLESGETPEQAIRRECHEELGVIITELQAWPLDVADPAIEPYAFVVTGWQGEPVNGEPAEHDDLAWFSIEELPTLHFAHPDLPRWLARVLEHTLRA